MYMAPIARTRSPASPLTRRLVGVPVLLGSAVLLLPWLAINAAVSGAVVCVLALASSPRVLLQAVDYAGEVALGR